MTIQGSCNCGDVKFEISASVSNVYVCHCSICRKSTGSGGIAIAITTNDSFSWLAGKEHIKTWQKPDHDWQTSFCCNCGSPLPGKNDDSTSYVPVSLLDSGFENLQVRHHLFVDSKAPWEEIADQGAIHSKAYREENG